MDPWSPSGRASPLFPCDAFSDDEGILKDFLEERGESNSPQGTQYFDELDAAPKDASSAAPFQQDPPCSPIAWNAEGVDLFFLQEPQSPPPPGEETPVQITSCASPAWTEASNEDGDEPGMHELPRGDPLGLSEDEREMDRPPQPGPAKKSRSSEQGAVKRRLWRIIRADNVCMLMHMFRENRDHIHFRDAQGSNLAHLAVYHRAYNIMQALHRLQPGLFEGTDKYLNYPMDMADCNLVR